MHDMTAEDAVLVVDDDEHVRSLAEDLFGEFSAFEVHTAPDVDTARTVLADRDDVRCVVCDYVLPEETGVEFLRSLRDDGDDVPFVLLTGNGNEDVVDAAFDAGADDYFRKDASASTYRVLVRRVENLVEQRDAQRTLERERERFQTLIEASTDLITILDDAGRYRYVSPAVEQVFGYAPEELLGENAFKRIHPDDRERVFERFEYVVADPGNTVESLEYRYRTGDGDYRWFESTGKNDEHDAVGGYVVNTRDVTERKRRERALEALNDAMRDLIAVDDRASIAAVLAETPERVTSATNAAYYAWDDETGSLKLRAHTWTSDPLPEEVLGDSPVWDGFVSGTTTRVGGSGGGHGSLPVDAAHGLVVPVDSEGALLCVSPDPFDSDDVHVAELFAAGCQAAFDRTEYRDVLERKERELDEEREQLARATRINDVVRGIDQVLVRSADKRAVAQSVCRELAAADFVEMAWFGVRTDDGLDAVDWAGGDEGFVEQVLAHANDADRAPARVALDTQEPVHVTSVLDDDRCAGIRRPALNRGYRSLLSVPIVHRGTDHGVLELYATDPRSFSVHDLAVFDELGDTIGYACSAIDQRDAVVTDAVVEVEVSLSAVDDSLYRAAAGVDAPVTVTDVVSKPDRYLAYLETDAEAALRDALDEQRPVDDVTELSDARVEARLSEFPLVDPLREYAGEFVRFEVDSSGASLVARLPGRVDVRSFVDDLESLADDVELARKEAVTADAESVAALDLERHLTDRQREVLAVAYNHGFFTWPRGSTGKEVAASLDISAPTFHQHIRKSINSIVELALDRDSTDDDSQRPGT